MVNVTLNGKPYQCASCKEELTAGQYQWIIKNWGIDQPDLSKRNNIGLFGNLTNTDFKVAELDDTESEQAIYEVIAWVFGEQFLYPKDTPKALDIDGHVLLLPERVGGCSIGQNIILKQLIDSSKYIEETISMAAAIYLQPQYDSVNKRWFEFWKTERQAKFDYAKVKELERTIAKMPAALIYPIGFFLLNRALTNGKKPYGIWHRMRSSLSSG